MRAVVTGSSGRVGSFVVPALVRAGYEVISITRGTRQPFTAAMKEWDEVQNVACDREALEKEGRFGRLVMDFKPDVICDLICYEKAQAEQIAQAALGHVSHYMFIGSVWIYEFNVTVPADEDHPRNATSPYGRGKVEVEAYLRELWHKRGFPFTTLHLGHVVGKGWSPINPQGNFLKSVYEDIAAGRPLLLPDRGTATVHHVHADDVANLLLTCLGNPEIALGQSYHVTSPQAVTLRGFAEAMYAKFGQTPDIRYVSLDELVEAIRPVSPIDARKTLEHVSHSPCVSIEKARRELGYAPRSSLQAVNEALDYLVAQGILAVP